PALAASGIDVHEGLREGARSSAGQRPRRLRRCLVVAEVALALVLLVGGGLLLRSFTNVIRVDPGFRPDHVFTLRGALPTPNGPASDADYLRYRQFFEQATRRLQKLPGVSAAGAIDLLPLSGIFRDNIFEIEGSPTPPGAQPPDEELRWVTPGLFEALGIPIL